jgi:xanthine dehydrogenase YagS FAD-binding subunit
MLRNFAYVRPTSLDEAIKHLSKPGAVVHAGGTDLLGCLRDDVFEAGTLVSISRLDQLKGIVSTADGGMRIGALTTIADLASNRDIAERYKALAQAAAVVASPQLRAQGTIGGNICQKPRCWYYRGDYACVRKEGETCYAMEGENQYHCVFGGSLCYIVHPSDTAPALVALGAQAQLTGPRGRRSVPLDAFFVSPGQDLHKENVLEPGEVVTDILLPPLPAHMRSSYRKVRARGSWDFALASIALSISLRPDRSVASARVVLGGVAPIPWRSQDIERVIVGNRLDARTVAKAAAAAVNGAEPLEHNGYKVPLIRGIVEDALLAMA